MTQKRKHEKPKTRPGEEPEDALWRHVILQAIQDATLRLPDHPAAVRNKMEAIRNHARLWVERQTADFRRVCDLAGLEHSRVHTFAMSRIREAMAKERAAEFVKGSMPGVVAEITEGVGDRRTNATQKGEKIGFSQNQDSAP